MSDSSEPVQVDPAQPTSNEKATSVQPNDTKGLARLPTDVKVSVSKVDETLLRLNKYARSSPPLAASSLTPSLTD